jgi:hypothetical protein
MLSWQDWIVQSHAAMAALITNHSLCLYMQPSHFRLSCVHLQEQAQPVELQQPSQLCRCRLHQPGPPLSLANQLLFYHCVLSSLSCRSKPNLLSFNSRVSFVGVGFIKLERQLPYNVSTRWAPGLYIFERECY